MSSWCRCKNHGPMVSPAWPHSLSLARKNGWRGRRQAAGGSGGSAGRQPTGCRFKSYRVVCSRPQLILHSLAPISEGWVALEWHPPRKLARGPSRRLGTAAAAFVSLLEAAAPARPAPSTRVCTRRAPSLCPSRSRPAAARQPWRCRRAAGGSCSGQAALRCSCSARQQLPPLARAAPAEQRPR